MEWVIAVSTAITAVTAIVGVVILLASWRADRVPCLVTVSMKFQDGKVEHFRSVFVNERANRFVTIALCELYVIQPPTERKRLARLRRKQKQTITQIRTFPEPRLAEDAWRIAPGQASTDFGDHITFHDGFVKAFQLHRVPEGDLELCWVYVDSGFKRHRSRRMGPFLYRDEALFVLAPGAPRVAQPQL